MAEEEHDDPRDVDAGMVGEGGEEETGGAERSEKGDIRGGTGVSNHGTIGTGPEGDISHGDGGMGSGRGADVRPERSGA
jgi:hypothetical protein